MKQVQSWQVTRLRGALKLFHASRRRPQLTSGIARLNPASDTFRAAANDQLAIWAERSGVPLIQQKPGTDPSAVLFDSIRAAKARNADVLIIDTAGRLHTKTNLMQELEKMRRGAGCPRTSTYRGLISYERRLANTRAKLTSGCCLEASWQQPETMA